MSEKTLMENIEPGVLARLLPSPTPKNILSLKLSHLSNWSKFDSVTILHDFLCFD